MKSKKVIALLLSIVMLLSIITNCSKTVSIGKGPSKDRVVQVSGDSSWYDAKRVECGREYEELGLESYYLSDPEVTSDGVLIYVDGYYDSVYDEETDEYSANILNEIAYYDFDGNIIWKSDVSSLANIEDGNYRYIMGITNISNKYYLAVYEYSDDVSENKLYAINMSTGEVSSTGDENSSLTSIYSEDLCANIYPERIFDGDSFTVFTYYFWTEEKAKYTLIVRYSNGDEQWYDLDYYFPKDEIWDISAMYKINEDEVLFSVSGTFDYIKFNVRTNTFEKFEGSSFMQSLANKDFFNLSSGIYTNDSTGIYKIDFENEAKVNVFSYNDCYVNFYETSSLALNIYEEDRIVMTGFRSNTDFQGSYVVIYEFTKAQSNPNKDKIILRASNLGTIDEITGEALYEYNTSNKDYFIKYDEDYSVDYDSLELINTDDYTTELLNMMNSLNTKLEADLMSGEGPDIILNAFSNNQFNNTDYLVDLTDYMKEVDSDDYFVNIIDASRVDGKLYQLPISFGFDALIGKRDLSSNNVGFTFDEYKTAIEELCDNIDPMAMYSGREDIFSVLLSRMTTSITDEKGNIHLDSDEFRAICEYCKTLQEKSYYDSAVDSQTAVGSMGYMGSVELPECKGIQDVKLNSAYYLLEVVLLANSGGDYFFYGYPSYNGVGASAEINSSVAISASCPNCDAAWEFIETMLSPSVLARSIYFTISRTALIESSEPVIAEYNQSAENNRLYYSEAEAKEYNIPYEYASQESLKQIINAISNISSVNTFDTQFMEIILEEMTAYYYNQKSLDDVIVIIENKCQTIKDGRG